MNSPADTPADVPSGSGVSVSADGPVVTVRLNRPEKLNAITPEMHVTLQDAFDAFAACPSQRIAILASSGRVFCAGSDLKAAAERRTRGEGHLAMPRSGYGGIVQRFDLDKPVIAAVHGDAIGGGFELALACDMIVAAESARFAFPEPRAGMVAIGGGPHRLARAIGVKRAMDIILTGRWVDAREALSMGFINRVVPDDQVEEACHGIAMEILRGGPAALRASKQLLNSTLDQTSLAAAIGDQESLPAMIDWRASDEAKQGSIAFAAKRKPQWAPK